MERVSLLINKLQQLQQENAGTDILLAISQMLVAELQAEQQHPSETSKVSVIMPKRNFIVSAVETTAEPVMAVAEAPAWTAPVLPIAIVEEPKPEVVAIVEPIAEEVVVEEAINEEETLYQEEVQVPETIAKEEKNEEILLEAIQIEEPEELQELVAEVSQPEITETPREEYVLVMPAEEVQEVEEVKEIEIVEEIASVEEKEATPPSSIMENAPGNFFYENYAQHIPTLPHFEAVHKPATHETLVLAEEKDINSSFKEGKVEVAHLLENTPIKDLRKAISINDRYLFINELFRGDETMFDRSIKTIQNYTILPEATFWIQRELKVKLGWPSKSEVVELFDQLVKRRFS
ncbi:hypothetical protein [Parasediminibacterium sp. JCM 36343]|uniref:hypothetical protein n=1 Tax=Parasediminibacterium sp. JCM 36343 TaxID=3374279 RepID=UPI00397C6C54